MDCFNVFNLKNEKKIKMANCYRYEIRCTLLGFEGFLSKIHKNTNILS